MKHITIPIILLILCLVVAGCTIPVTPTIPGGLVETVQSGIDEVKPEIEQQLTQLPSTLESMATEYAPTIQNLATAVPATLERLISQEPTDAPQYTGEMTVIESNNLIVKLPVEVAESASIIVIPEQEPNEIMPGFELPEHRLINFIGYEISEHFHTPVIHILPVDETTEISQYASINISTLQYLLENPEIDLDEEEFLPFLPVFNAAQIFNALPERIETENGQGIRYLALYSQAFAGIDNYNIFYTYQGLSADGKYYIAAVLPINSSLLPEMISTQEELDELTQDYQAYIADVEEEMEKENGGVLTPSLEALDAMIRSLKILD